LNQKVLITGGAGFIGSVISAYLLDHGYQVVLIDDLSTGNIEAVDFRATFYKASIFDKEFVAKALLGIDTVIHCAARSSIEESLSNPDQYNNINYQGTEILLEMMLKFGVNKLIFSSTAAVYGDIESNLISESSELKPINPYGESKIKCEDIISKKVSDGLAAISFRYFNVAGSYKNKYGRIIFENHRNESHLIPKILNLLHNNNQIIEVDIYGSSLETPDGSCVRDYLHVNDLAHAHLIALNKLSKYDHKIINLGSGIGYSVFEVLNYIDETLGVKLSRNICPPRLGDPKSLVADIAKAEKLLEWWPKFGLREIVYDSWRGSQQLR
jgi:UDP-glucose 4-epimerase